MIVIDASALVAYLLREEGFERIRDLLYSSRTLSPDLAAKEAANAILVALRRGRISRSQASRVFSALKLILAGVVEVYPELELLEEAYSIALATSLTIYDSLYIALARRVGGRLATRDRRQYEAAKRLGVDAILV